MVAAVTAAGLVALPELARRVLVWRLATTTGRAITIDSLELQLMRGRVAVRGLRIVDRDGAPLATLGRLEAQLRALDLLRGRIHLLSGTLDALSIRIVRSGSGEFNVSDLLVPKGDRGGAGLAATIDRFTVRNVIATIEDRTVTPARTWQAALEAEAQGIAPGDDHPAGTASVRATIGDAPLSLEITDLRLAPLRLRGTFTARDVDAMLASLVLPPASPVAPARGVVNASGTISHDAGGSLVALDIGVRGVELRRYNTTFLTAPAIRMTVDRLRVAPQGIEVARVNVDGGTITLADAQLGTSRRWQVEGVTLEAKDLSSTGTAGTARGSAQMSGAEMSLWAASVRLAPLRLYATAVVRNVDLAVMRAYLPPALPVLPERGVVNATLTVDHDGASVTRLRADAALGGIELIRPGHVVTAPGVRVVAEDVVLDRGTVTAGRTVVTAPRVMLEERTAKPVRTWVVQDVVAEAKDLSSRRDAAQGVATLQATVAGATASAWATRVRLDPLEFHLTASLRNVDLGLARLYLPPESLVEFTRGAINGALDADYTQAEGTRLTGDVTLTGMEARGRWQLSTVTATAPAVRLTLADVRQRGETLSVGRVEVNGTGTVVDSRAATSKFDLTQMRLVSEGLTWPARAPARVALTARFGDRGELDANGTAMLTAPPPAIAWSTELAIAFRGVDLTPLGGYVPIARGVGGRVRANVTATVAYAGTLTARVRGDVAGGRFALVDGGRTLLSLRRIDAKGLDVQWPDRIAIEQVRLREPSAIIERDRQGRVTLMDRFAPPATAGGEPAPAATIEKSTLPPVAIDELIVERGNATVLDASGTVPARMEVTRLDVTARDVTWPKSATPMRLTLDAGLAGGGSAKVEGTVIGEPGSVDLKIALANADVEPLQPYLPFRAQVRGKIDATLTVSGPVMPTPQVKVQGDAAVRTFSIADGPEPLVTVAYIGVTGIDATWPERVTLDRVLVRRSWALIERNRQGQFILRPLLERPPGGPAVTPPAAIAAPARFTIPLTVREIVFEQQGATIVDAVTTPPARFDVSGARLKINDLTWPSQSPMKIDLSSPMPGGGRVTLTGGLQLDPLRLDARAVLDAVAITPVQPYLPIEGTVAGQVSGTLAVKVEMDESSELTVQATGETHLQRFQLNDGDRAVVTSGRVDVAGIDIDWPRRLAVGSVQLRRPRLLVERDALGQIRLWKVAVPDWTAAPAASPPPAPAAPAPAAAAPPTLEIATLRLERASARFVDQSTTPTYAEELSNVELTVTPLTTAPGRRGRFTASGAVGGGSFTSKGEVTAGERPHVDLTVELRDFVVPRANPYLDLYTGWTATRGSLSLTGTYTLNGTRLETRHDVVVRDLDLDPVDTRDEVERRVGLPFGLLVSLLKDSRGTIKLSLPVAGDLSRREFDFQDAMWSAVRALSVRLVALPFSRIGSLFVSDDSKVEAVAITPVMFDPGTAQLATGMDAHLQKIGGFMRDTPAVKLAIKPIFTQADADALKDGADPADAMHALGEKRLAAVRETLGRAGIDAERLPGRVPRRPLVEGAGTPRVELNPRGQVVEDTPRGG